MKKRLFKSVLALLLCVCMTGSSFACFSVHATENEETAYLQVQLMKYDGESDSYKEDGSSVWIDAMSSDGCVLVDFQAICEALKIKEKGGEYLLEKSPTEQEAKSKLIFTVNDGFYKSYQDAFGVELNESSEQDGISIQKNVDSDMKFYMRVGSDVVFMYSSVAGMIKTSLGANVIKSEEKIMVPLAMLLNLVDTSYAIEGNTLYMYPDDMTVMDIITDTTINTYNFDLVADTDIDEDEYILKTGGITLYRKLKDIFQGVATLDFEKIATYIGDTSVVAANLAEELARPSSEEESKIIEKASSNIEGKDVYNVLFEYAKDRLEKLSQQAKLDAEEADKLYLQILEEWDSAEKNLNDYVLESSSVSLDSKIENIVEFFEAEQADMLAEEYTKWKADTKKSIFEGVSKSVDFGTTIFSAGLSASIKYGNLVAQIENADAESVEAVEKYIEHYNKRYDVKGGFGGSDDPQVYMLEGNVSMSKGLIDEIEKNIKMYKGSETNLLQNEELSGKVFGDVANSLAGAGTGKLVSKVIPGIGSLKGVVLSFTWDVLEVLANNATGKSFDALDALYTSIFLMNLEQDSEVITAWYADTDDLDLCRQLMWVKLKSYYLTRMNYLAYCYPEKIEQYKTEIPEPATEMPELAAEIDELLEMMAVLMCGNIGVIQDGLNEKCEKIKENNEEIIAILGRIHVEKIELTNDTYYDTSQEMGYEYATITSYSDTGDIVWSYETPKYVATELTAVVEIGQKGNCYYFVEDTSVVCMDVQSGTILWKNDDYAGRATAFAFGENAIYLCGQYGPDFYAIGYDGTSLAKIEQFDTQYYWAGKIELLIDTAAVYLYGGTEDYNIPMIYYVDLETFDFSKSYNVKSDEPWKNAYIQFINEQEPLYDIFNGERAEIYKLVDINGDDIPELYICNVFTFAGDMICTYANDSVQSEWMSVYGFSYLEGKNIFMDSGGRMDAYHDIVYSMVNGKITELHRGEYGAEDNSQVQIDANGEPVYEYFWDGAEVTKDEYNAQISNTYNKQESICPITDADWNDDLGRYSGNGLCTYFEIIEAIYNYSK